MQVEGRAVIQDVQLEADETDGVILPHPSHGGELQARGVDDGERATAYDLQGLVRADESGCVLIQPDADGERVVSQRGE
jgi:hypothetical protein